MTTLQTAAIIRYDNCYCLKLKPRTDMVIDTLKTTQARYMLQPTK
ncbi:7972_t:CDS:1, partial [Funneliformis mosseae]